MLTALEAKPKVASLNVCADQLVLALADAAQIAALSPLSRDPNLSHGWRRAGEFRQAGGGAEEIIRLEPDVVLMGKHDKASTRELVQRLGPPVTLVELWQGFDHGKAQIRLVAAALDQRPRGEALIQRIAEAEAAAADAGRGRNALILGRGGYADGPASLTASLLAAAGLKPVETGQPFGGFVALELLVSMQPDIVVTASSGYGDNDQRAAFLRHPALQAMLERTHWIILPNALSVCEASLPEALDALAKQLRAR